MHPLVSVIIPYNRDRSFLKEAIQSVDDQIYHNIELILSESPGSVGYNLNRGIEKAKGKFIKYLCDDDLLPYDSIENSISAFANGVDFIHGTACNFWPDGKSDIYTPDYFNPTLEQMLSKNVIHGGTLMYRREVFEKYGMFDETLWTGEEYEFNLRILAAGARLGYCEKPPLYFYRRHAAQKSLGNTSSEYQRKRAIAIQAIKNKYL